MTSAKEIILKIQPIIKVADFEETDKSVSFDFRTSTISQSSLESLLEAVHLKPEFFRTFQVRIEFENQRPPLNLITKGISGLSLKESDKWDDETEGDWKEFRRLVSYYIDNDEFHNVADEILSINEENTSTNIHLNINKLSIGKRLLQETTEYNGDVILESSVWMSEISLKNWVQDGNYQYICSDLLNGEEYPVFLFLSSGETEEQGVIPTQYVIESDNIGIEPEKIEEYQRLVEQAGHIERNFQSQPFTSPLIFSTPQLRWIFSDAFVYSSFVSLSGNLSSDGQTLSIKIKSEKGHLSGEIKLDQWRDPSFSTEKEELFGLMKEFLQRGDQKAYRRIWHSAIVAHCSTIDEIPLNKSDIIYYYRSLEKEAIEGNFEELSGAVQDAQIFIGDVTNTLSSSTVNLTNEIQKVVLAIFGGVAGNLFLLLRQSSIESGIVFTVVFIGVLLLVYFPTVQERVDELTKIIEEGKSDTDLYSDLIKQIGAHKLTDTERFEKRHEAYIRLAEERKDWAERKLSLAFDVLSIIWALGVLTAILIFNAKSVYLLTASSTVLIAIWLTQKQSRKQYYHQRTIQWLPSGPILVVLATIIGFVSKILL